ncbi:MAG: HlyC/CorC family transporter [Bacteroidaceae bacterium]|nr:HlyC/CorC family transporter [Bacteroidaceae bacterium]
MTITILQLVVVILFSALFSGMEIAFVSSNKLLMGIDLNDKGIRSYVTNKYYSNSNNFVSSLLVGNNIVLVIYGILMAKLLMEPLNSITKNDGVHLFLETVISTIIIIFTGEFIPKAMFRINPNGAMKRFAVPLYPVYVLLYPLARFTTWISCLILRIFNVKIDKEARDTTFSKNELNDLIQDSIDNAKDEQEKIDNDVKIFQNALNFSDIRVRDCYVPRTEIDAIEVNSPIEELKSMFIESGHSKIVVFKDTIDNIIGYIHSSELFRCGDKWQKKICKMPIVPETLSAQKLMRILMQQKKTLAVVLDEFGGTSGIISLEDLVEEIIGDIEDEHDSNNHIAKKLGDGEYLLSGRLEVERINELFAVELPESDEYQTLGGLILSYHQRFPQINETITIDKFQMRIVKQRSNKIELVKMKILE